MSPRLVPIAEVQRPHGITGELRVRLYNEASDLLLQKPQVVLRLADGTERTLRLAAVRPNNQVLLVRFEGVVDRNGADLLRGAIVSVPREMLPPPEEGEVYLCDLEGARVVDGEREVGKVVGIRNFPTCDALLVEKPDGTNIEVPMLPAFVVSADPDKGIVEITGTDALT
jgi:16S rRNA processing protein RimM